VKHFFLQQRVGPAENYFIAQVKAVNSKKARLYFEAALGELPDNCVVHEIGGLSLPSVIALKPGQVRIVEPLRGEEKKQTGGPNAARNRRACLG